MTQKFQPNINGKPHTVEMEGGLPLLWVIREHLQLSGTKFSSGISQCGAFTVHVDGQPVRSCQVQVGQVVGRRVTTIEWIPENHPVKRAWVDLQVRQCGYCQSGQIVAAVALLRKDSAPSGEEIIRAMDGNLCR